MAAVLLAACLVVPAGALGQARTLGSPLTRTPNLHGCETEPTFTANSSNGDYEALPSGDPDCTWFQSGVVGAQNYSDPRTGSVPSDGTITTVSVRSGPNPSPLRFVVVRQFEQSAGGFCCAFVPGRETPLVQPRPNQVSTFTVNLPVERNVDTQRGIITADYIGLSGVTGGNRTLPIADTGNNNTLTGYTAGSPVAGFLYPRLGQRPGDTGGGRNESGIPNVEVLLQWTWVPAGGAGRDGAAPSLGRPAFGPRIFVVGPNNTPVAAKAKRGSKLSFTVNERSKASIRIEKPKKGRRSKGKCRKPTRKNRKGKKCKRWVKAAATLTRNNVGPGKVSIKFTGRIRRKALKRGRYRASITATDATGNRSKPRRASFRIVRR